MYLKSLTCNFIVTFFTFEVKRKTSSYAGFDLTELHSILEYHVRKCFKSDIFT